jgi:RNA polymerase subunit RPABC4/transcription elongation factor Spt4
MSGFRFRRLERHRVGGTAAQMELSYPVPRSPSGKAYRYSPNPQATPRLFLIGDSSPGRVIPVELRPRMRLEPGSDQTVCPYSGHIAADEEFIHFDDIEAIKRELAWEVAADVQDVLKDLARDFNSRQPRDGLVSIRMETSATRKPKPVAIRTDLLRDLECDVCRRPYSVYALALFCPDCGSPNIAHHFRREIVIVSEEIEIADRLGDERRGELAYRLMGNAHEDVLTAFEATLKALYCYLVRQRFPNKFNVLCTKKEMSNAFQNIDRAQEKYQALEIDPFEGVRSEDISRLRLDIQKRHVIGHNLGIADDGETVRVLGEDIRRFADVCLQAVVNLERHLVPAKAPSP